ncbi:hypothetical protein K1W54_22200 [Micromonospora sp. CPCC 205371]|nr:hypothetical protein [Micromonospora sp. CPCC 205371]
MTDGRTALHGDVTACAPASGTAFALAYFGPEDFSAEVDVYSLVEYRPEGPTPFSRFFNSAPAAGHIGVCAMRTLSDRIACVRVTWPADRPATMEPIPATDPLVAKPVNWITTPPPSGFCGSCLGDPGWS